MTDRMFTEATSGVLHGEVPAGLFEAAHALVPASGPAAPGADSVLARELLAQGGAALRGDVHGDRWSMVVHSSDTELARGDELRRLVGRRRGRIVVVPAGQSLESWWRAAPRRPRTVTVIGTATPWQEVEALQRCGPLVGRLPFVEPHQVEAWAERANTWWEDDRTAMERRAWIVAPADDDFTRQLASSTFRALDRALEEKGFETPSMVPPKPGEAIGLVVLMTHGRESPAGEPEIPAADRERVLRAAESGALILHLGCHGAGRQAGGRYNGVLQLVDSPPISFVDHDVHSPFAIECLERGATAVIGHLDGTWSGTFRHPHVLVELIELLADGECTAGYAVGRLADEAHRHARAAMEHKIGGDLGASGEAWVRYLDLSGFVCLGESCAALRWKDPGPATT